MRIIFRTLQHRLQAVRPQHLPDERTNHQYRRYGLPLRHRIRFKSAYRHTYPAPIRCTESAGYDWRRCNRTAVQLYHCHFAGKRPSSTPLVNAALSPLAPWYSRWAIRTRSGMPLYRISQNCAAPLRNSSTNCTNRKRLRTSTTAPLPGY